MLHQKARNWRSFQKAKQFHGARCQAWELSFPERYREIGEGYIEAHHLKPISSLEEGVPVHYDVAADFAVLCSKLSSYDSPQCRPEQFGAISGDNASIQSIRAQSIAHVREIICRIQPVTRSFYNAVTALDDLRFVSLRCALR